MGFTFTFHSVEGTTLRKEREEESEIFFKPLDQNEGGEGKRKRLILYLIPLKVLKAG